MGTEKVEHARCTFAVVEDSRRVTPRRPRWPVVPPPPASCPREAPPPPPTKGRGRAPPQTSGSPHRAAGAAGDAYTVHATSSKRPGRKVEVEVETEDVIDLGAPRQLRQASAEGKSGARVRRPIPPNPRLYPGPPPQKKPKGPPKLVENQQRRLAIRRHPAIQNQRHENQRPESRQAKSRRPENRRTENRGNGEKRRRRRKCAFRRVVPNSRLYRPPAARPPPPPASPHAKWSPLVPSARLDTASRVALHLSEQRRGLRPAPAPASPPGTPPAPPQSPQLVVTLPPSGAAPPQRYRPTSTHFRLRSLDMDSGETTPVAGRLNPHASRVMDPANRHSTSPEDWSDGNETLSAPSEFLAEFLSAIMRRQYAEALKYCRLILQYEPQNATARGFYPLLQHKVQAHKRADEERPRGSSSEEASGAAGEPPAPHTSQLKQDLMEQGGDSSEGSEEEGDASRPSSRSGGSCCSQSSLEMDSSEALAHSSPSLSLSRRTDSASAGCCDSAGSASRSDADDNGNATSVPAPAHARPCASDVENDNEPLSAALLKSESLQQLRAQFTCSIK